MIIVRLVEAKCDRKLCDLKTKIKAININCVFYYEIIHIQQKSAYQSQVILVP